MRVILWLDDLNGKSYFQLSLFKTLAYLEMLRNYTVFIYFDI